MIIFKVIYTGLAWTGAVVAFLISFVAQTFIVLNPFIKNKPEACQKSTIPILVYTGKLLGITFTAEGIENVPKSGAFIIASNHQSFLDIAIMNIFIPRKFCFFAKEELMKVPLVASQIRNLRHYPVDRSNPKKAKIQVDKAREDLENGVSNLLIFPEGTRSTDGTIAAFKRGAFMIAIQSGTTVIPARIENAINVANKKSWFIHPGNIHLKIGKPIQVEKAETKDYKEKSIALKDKVEEEIRRL